MAQASRDSGQTRRLLALAVICGGGSRAEAAENRGITRITSAFPQFGVSSYIESGRFVADLRASNAAYANARNALFDSLKRSCPKDASLQRPDAGFSIWVDLPLQVSSSQLYGQCMRLGVYPLLGKVFSLEDRPVCGARLAFGQNSETALIEAASRFGKALKAILHFSVTSRPNALP